jgi:uncharacterized protein
MPTTLQITYLDGPRLRRSLLAACEYTQRLRGELNRINVFPVPDGDTGTNLALTVRAIADHLRKNRDRSVGVVAHEAAQAAVLGARGNSGMMLSHFLLGFSREVGEESRIGTVAFAGALSGGVRSLYAALEKPVEGTILTVMRETAEAAGEHGDDPDFVPLIDLLLTRARESLERTPTLLPALKKAGVVDAGAKGFVGLLEGVLAYIHGDPLVALEESRPFEGGLPMTAGEVDYPSEEEKYRFCTEALVRGDALPDSGVVRAGLHEHGDSLIVIRTGDLLKIHIHTDQPEEVFGYLQQFGTLATHKAEDMRAQHAAVERAASGHITLARRPLSIVTDSAADVPEEVVRAHGIHVVPLMLLDGDVTLRDGIDITADEFHARMAEGDTSLPTTSQPTPGAFLDAYRQAAEDGEVVLAVVLGSGLSGTLASAEAAASRFVDAPIHVVDSLGASLLTGLLVLKATELAERAVPPEEIVQELKRIRARSGLFLTVDRFDRLLASGRVGKGRAWLGGILDVKPILGLDEAGKVIPVGKVRGREKVVPEMLRLLAGQVPPSSPGDGGSAPRVRFGVVHVGRPEIVAEVSSHLRARYGPNVEILDGPATPVLATHTGIGAWALTWMRED